MQRRRASQLSLVVERIDGRGRVRLEDAEVLGWCAGTHLRLDVKLSSVIVSRSDADDGATFGNDRRLTLTSSALHSLAVARGDRVALLTDLDEKTLTVVSATKVAEMLGASL